MRKKYSKMSRSTKRFIFFSDSFNYFVLTYVMFPVSCFGQRTCMAKGLLKGVLSEIELTHV